MTAKQTHAPCPSQHFSSNSLCSATSSTTKARFPLCFRITFSTVRSHRAIPSLRSACPDVWEQLLCVLLRNSWGNSGVTHPCLEGPKTSFSTQTIHSRAGRSTPAPSSRVIKSVHCPSRHLSCQIHRQLPQWQEFNLYAIF